MYLTKSRKPLGDYLDWLSDKLDEIKKDVQQKLDTASQEAPKDGKEEGATSFPTYTEDQTYDPEKANKGFFDDTSKLIWIGAGLAAAYLILKGRK